MRPKQVGESLAANDSAQRGAALGNDTDIHTEPQVTARLFRKAGLVSASIVTPGHRIQCHAAARGKAQHGIKRNDQLAAYQANRSETIALTSGCQRRDMIGIGTPETHQGLLTLLPGLMQERQQLEPFIATQLPVNLVEAHDVNTDPAVPQLGAIL